MAAAASAEDCRRVAAISMYPNIFNINKRASEHGWRSACTPASVSSSWFAAWLYLQMKAAAVATAVISGTGVLIRSTTSLGPHGWVLQLPDDFPARNATFKMGFSGPMTALSQKDHTEGVRLIVPATSHCMPAVEHHLSLIETRPSSKDRRIEQQSGFSSHCRHETRCLCEFPGRKECAGSLIR